MYCKKKKKMKYITVMPIFGLKNLDGEHHSIPCMQAYFIYRVFRKKSLAFSLATTGSRYLWYVQVFSKLLSGGFVCRAKWHHSTLPCNMGKKYKLCSKTDYRKVASSNMSRLEAHAGFFRLLIKGILDLALCTF